MRIMRLLPCQSALTLASTLLLTLPLLGAQSPSMLPAELVRRAVQNETNRAQAETKFMFQVHKKTPTGTQTKVFVQTREAVAGMVVAINDQPLTAEQRQGEIWRVKRFLKDPDEMKKKQKQEKEDQERIIRVIKALPDAFLYEYDGPEVTKASAGRPGSELTRLKFRPNPDYAPPSRVEQTLTGMQGYVLIDPKKLRIARIDGTLGKEVSFGWGILGHLDKGGHILIEQGDVGEGQWRIVRLDMSFTGKILLFKSISVQSTEVSSDFRPVAADLSFAQGVEMLKQQESLIAENLRKNAAGK